MTHLKRSAVIINSSLLVILSLFYLCVIESLSGGVSALKLSTFASFLYANKFIVAFAAIASISILLVRKVSSYILFVFSSLIVYKGLEYFFLDFDKVILILSFFYITLSYYFYLFLKLEMAEPFYNPCYPDNLLPGYEQKQLPIMIVKAGKRYPGYITNFSSSGFFCRLEGEMPRGLKGDVEVEAQMRETKFFYNGKLVTRNRSGAGVRITANPIPHVGWNSFYGIIKELGYRPS